MASSCTSTKPPIHETITLGNGFHRDQGTKGGATKQGRQSQWVSHGKLRPHQIFPISFALFTWACTPARQRGANHLAGNRPARGRTQARNATLAWLAAGRDAPYTLSKMMRTAHSLWLEGAAFRSSPAVGSRLLPGAAVVGMASIGPRALFLVVR